MARPQTFIEEEVLEKAMHEFWRSGYATTSIKELVEATRLQPGSLYGAFKNKRQLFIRSLELYFEQLFEDIKQAVDSEDKAEKRLRKLFDCLVVNFSFRSEQKSCFLLRTLLEVQQKDNEISVMVRRMYAQIEAEIYGLLVDARLQGSLKPGASPEIMARMLMSNIFGLQVYSHISSEEYELEQTINNIMCIFTTNRY